MRYLLLLPLLTIFSQAIAQTAPPPTPAEIAVAKSETALATIDAVVKAEAAIKATKEAADVVKNTGNALKKILKGDTKALGKAANQVIAAKDAILAARDAANKAVPLAENLKTLLSRLAPVDHTDATAFRRRQLEVEAANNALSSLSQMFTASDKTNDDLHNAQTSTQAAKKDQQGASAEIANAKTQTDAAITNADALKQPILSATEAAKDLDPATIIKNESASSQLAGGSSSGNEPLKLGSHYLRLGVGLGGSYNLNNSYSYALTTPNYTLTRDTESRLNGVASAILSYSPTYYYYERDNNGDTYGEPTVYPARYAVLASVNAVDVTSGFGFNRHLNLGLGLGWRPGIIDDKFNDLIVGVFFEFTYQRYLRDYYSDRIGQSLAAFGTTYSPAGVPTMPLNSLDINDDRFFVTRPIHSIGLKVVYLISGKDAPSESTVKAANAVH